jgi:hypothetical protein
MNSSLHTISRIAKLVRARLVQSVRGPRFESWFSHFSQQALTAAMAPFAVPPATSLALDAVNTQRRNLFARSCCCLATPSPSQKWLKVNTALLYFCSVDTNYLNTYENLSENNNSLRAAKTLKLSNFVRFRVRSR